jgi:hypothetical protein
MTKVSWFNSWQCKIIWSPQCPGWLWAHFSLMLMWYLGWSGWGKNTTTPVCLVPRWVCGPIPPPPCTVSYHGAWLSTRSLYGILNVVMLMSCQHGGCLLGSHTVDCAWLCHFRGAYCLHLQVGYGWDDIIWATTSAVVPGWAGRVPWAGRRVHLGWLGCLALYDLTSRSIFATSIEIIFWQSVHKEEVQEDVGTLFYPTAHVTSLRLVHLMTGSIQLIFSEYSLFFCELSLNVV